MTLGAGSIFGMEGFIGFDGILIFPPPPEFEPPPGKLIFGLGFGAEGVSMPPGLGVVPAPPPSPFLQYIKQQQQPSTILVKKLTLVCVAASP